MDFSITELINAAHKCLVLCGVKSGDMVVIWTDARTDTEFNQAFFGAALSLDAELLMVVGTRTVRPNVPPPDIALDLLKKADIVLDCASSPWMYTPEYASILKLGVPILHCGANRKEDLMNRIPTREMGENVKMITQFLTGKKVRITSDIGTDLEVVEPGRPWSYFVGYIERPDHLYDSLPGGVTALYPKVGTVSGTAVVDGIMQAPWPGVVPEAPVKFTIKESRIIKIEGGNDAKNAEAFFESFNDPNVHLFAHLCFGLDPRIGKAVATIEAEAREGQITIAFGSSILPMGGGDVAAKIHCDMLLMDADMIVDDQLIIDKGKILYEKLK